MSCFADRRLPNKLIKLPMQLQLAPISAEMSREDMLMGDSSSGGGASPLTARSMRLERVAQALAHSQEELRRYVLLKLTENAMLSISKINESLGSWVSICD